MIALCLVGLLQLQATLADTAGARLIDGFERVDRWTAHPAEGVKLAIRSDVGRTGRAMRLDFAFTSGGGYAIAHRAVAIDLPANYAFSFWIRGVASPNTLEFKLIDASGDNVWWYTRAGPDVRRPLAPGHRPPPPGRLCLGTGRRWRDSSRRSTRTGDYRWTWRRVRSRCGLTT